MSELGLSPIDERDPSLGSLKRHFSQLVKKATNTRDNISPKRFPGTMPLTLSRRHFKMILTQDFVALEKSDGTRYMLFAVSQRVFLIDRRMHFYDVQPHPQILDQSLTNPQENTILDGELTYNIVMSQWQYLIYDCISIDGDTSVAMRGFRERMLAAENFIAGPRLWLPFCAGLLNIRIKDYYEKKDIRNLFSRIKKDPKGHYLYINNHRRDGVLCNENDGIIICPVGMPYQTKKCAALLKWKPPHLNSIDFTLFLEKKQSDPKRPEPDVKCFIGYQGEQSVIRLREFYARSALRRKWAGEYDRYNRAIVELSYNRNAGEWIYIRMREDKESPNFSSTVIDTMETIIENIEREELVSSMEKHSQPPPKDQLEIVDCNLKNATRMTFTNDLFDEDNPYYVAATPISLVATPHFAGHERSRKRPRDHDSKQPNGKRRRNDTNATRSQEDRMPVSYQDDV